MPLPWEIQRRACRAPRGRWGHVACTLEARSMSRRITVGRFLGVEVALDWSWIITFVLAAWTLVSAGARVMPNLGRLPLALLGVASAAGLFASLVLHELAHGLAARASGVPVRHITLFLLGGITDRERTPASPRIE